MLDRFVSIFSLMVAIASMAIFGLFAWRVASGAVSEGDGVFVLGGCLLAAMVFTYRFLDPADVEVVSVVKAG